MRRLGKLSVLVVVVVVAIVVFVVKLFSGPFYFGTREMDFGYFTFGTSSDRAFVFELKTFRCLCLEIRFGKTLHFHVSGWVTFLPHPGLTET